jgi:hypothetical protein
MIPHAATGDHQVHPQGDRGVLRDAEGLRRARRGTRDRPPLRVSEPAGRDGQGPPLAAGPRAAHKVGGKTVIPDATLCDEYNLHRGYWEAKDTDDKLDVEIKKKIAKGYPLTNTIFEDTRQAVLL